MLLVAVGDFFIIVPTAPMSPTNNLGKPAYKDVYMIYRFRCLQGTLSVEWY